MFPSAMRPLVPAIVALLLAGCGGGDPPPDPPPTGATPALTPERPETSAPPGPTIAVGPGPVRVAVDPVSHRVYVGHRHGSPTLTVIGGAAPLRPVLHTLDLDLVVGGLAIDEQRRLLYLSVESTEDVLVFDISRPLPAEVARLGVGLAPAGIAVDPGGLAYVALSAEDAVAIVDGNADPPRVAGTVRVGSHPVAVAVDPVVQRVYVANEGDGSVSVIDALLRIPRVSAILRTGKNPVGVTVDPRTNRAFVANSGGDTVTVIVATETTLGRLVRMQIPSPGALAADPRSHLVLVAQRGEPLVGLLRGDRAPRWLEEIEVPAMPLDVAIDSGLGIAYVVSGDAAVVTVLPLEPW